MQFKLSSVQYVFFTNTPAHVHLYKHAIDRLQRQGHEVLVLGRDYGCTRALLEHYDLPHTIYGACGETKWSLFTSLPGHFVGIARAIRTVEPDHIFGMGAYAAFAGLISDAPPILLLDSEPTGIDHAISRRLARIILTPHAFRKDLGRHHYRFEGFKECAYLHPAVFDPDPSIRYRLGVGIDERYAVVRFNAFGSHHDIGRRGFSAEEQARLVEHLAEYVTVLVSSETAERIADHPDVEPYDLHPAYIHDVLAEASLLVADSQTMVTEAALLGTPAIRSNSFVGKSDMGNFVELERQGLIYNMRTFDDVLSVSSELLDGDPDSSDWRRRYVSYVSELIDLTELIVTVANDPDSVGRLPELTGFESRRDRPVGHDDALSQ